MGLQFNASAPAKQVNCDGQVKQNAGAENQVRTVDVTGKTIDVDGKVIEYAGKVDISDASIFKYDKYDNGVFIGSTYAAKQTVEGNAPKNDGTIEYDKTVHFTDKTVDQDGNVKYEGKVNTFNIKG